MLDVHSLIVNFQITGCPNRCAHCWAEGGERIDHTPVSEILSVLDQLCDLRERFRPLHLFFLHEATCHPEFPTIFAEASERKLWNSRYSFLATNGYGLRRADTSSWELLATSGIEYVQFTFYGWEEEHDRFAGRRGAHEDLILSIDRANEHGLAWVGMLVAHRRNLGDLSSLRRRIGELGRDDTVCGVILPLYQGRGREDALRPTAEDLEDADLGFRPSWYSESDLAGEVASEPEAWVEDSFSLHSGQVTLEITGSLEVFVSGGACDCGGVLGAVPQLRDMLGLGSLKRDTLADMVEGFTHRPPELLEVLAAASPAELVQYA